MALLWQAEGYVQHGLAQPSWDGAEKSVREALAITNRFLRRPDKDSTPLARKGSTSWWSALVLHYRAEAVEYILQPSPIDQTDDRQTGTLAHRGAKMMRTIRRWQESTRPRPPLAALEQLGEVYTDLAGAGFQELSLSAQALAEAEKQARVREAGRQAAEAVRRQMAARERQRKVDLWRRMGDPASRSSAVRKYFRERPHELPAFTREYPTEMGGWLEEPLHPRA